MKPKGEEENLTTSLFIGARTNSYWTEDEATWAIQDFNFLFTNVFPLDDETTLPSGAMETVSSLVAAPFVYLTWLQHNTPGEQCTTVSVPQSDFLVFAFLSFAAPKNR